MPAEGGHVGPMFASLGPISALCSPMLAVCCPRSALCWPMSALRWPYVGLSWPYVGPMLALRCAIVTTHFAHLCSNTFNMWFFPFGPPPRTPKPRKTPGFLTHCQDKIPGDRRAPNTVKHEVEQWLLQKIGIFGAFFPKFHAVGTLKIRANSQNLIFC